jgi:8-oxo-dGTP pyrophosphatase MutT (NUDIX family)
MPATGRADITTTGTSVVYENRWMRVREDTIQRRDGSDGIYGVVEKPDFVVIVPLNGDRLHLVEQFRYPVGARYWELPQGSWEEAPDADPLELARGELQEETGLRAAKMIEVDHLFRSLRLLDAGLSHFSRQRPEPRRSGQATRGAGPCVERLHCRGSRADDLRGCDQGRRDGRRVRAIAAQGPLIAISGSAGMVWPAILPRIAAC